MAIIWGKEKPYQESGMPVGEPCFFCGKEADSPMVYWAGQTSSLQGPVLVLHPGCAVDLTVRLYRDVHEVQQTLEGHIEMVTDPGLHRTT